MNQWEVCPKCQGEGTVSQPLSNQSGCVCSVCMGRMIINSFTGNPPKLERPPIGSGIVITGPDPFRIVPETTL